MVFHSQVAEMVSVSFLYVSLETGNVRASIIRSYVVQGGLIHDGHVEPWQKRRKSIVLHREV